MTLLRRIILGTAGNRLVTRFVLRHGMKLGARRFVAGETWDQAVGHVQRLNAQGVVATMDYLGESVVDRPQALAARDVYLDLLERINLSGVKANVSLKLTQMGLDIAPEFCAANVEAIVDRAARLGNFVRIDMEDSPRTDRTIAVFRRLRERFNNVGLVLQAYLFRSEDDVRTMADLGASLRLCKGAYFEPASVAFPRKRDVDENFKRLISLSLELGCHTAIATHDQRIITWAEDLTRQRAIPRDLCEFQMLYGIRSALQRRLAADGHTVRVYVPFGEQWYPYFTRRLAERPANVFFFLSNLWRS